MIKKYLFLLFVFFIQISCFSRDLPDFDKFWAILIKLESGGKTNTVGDAGRAIGPAQIHKAYFLDAQEYNKELNKYKYSDCFNPDVAKEVVKAYLSRYCKENDFESWARCHNSGPEWKNKKELTNKYWNKFKKIQKSISGR